ncbi:MAG: non-ribosomal peptide synthetase, partial [Bacteroidetes bacterium]
MQRLFPGNPFYHYAERYELQGALDVDRFFEAFEAVAWVQQQLRTTFPLDEAGHPYPLLHPQPLVQRRLLDWSDRDGEDLSAELEALLQEEARRPFDLEKGPLTRLLLVARPEQGWTLLVTCHHIIVDKWSMRILRGEWARAYQALLNGTPPNPNPPPVQYEDFAWWERHQPPPPEHLQFWKLKLEDLPEALPLPTDRPRPPRPSFNGAFLERPLPPALAEALKGLARNAETTLFTLLLTAFKVLLFRYSGQRDLCVGTPLSNRNRSELEHLIGFFNETILLRTRLDPESSFRAFLHRVHRETQEAFRHHQVPFETLVRTLKPERALSANPFFQVMCLYHRVEEEAPFAPELRMRVAPFDLGVAKFDLTLYLSDAPDELRLIVEYATDLFEAATVERMLDHLVRLLEAAVRSPDTPLRALPLLNPEERRRILVEWNATAQPPLDASTVVELIERQAAERPEHPAVISEDGGLSYGELAARSSALAALLRAEGVGQGAVVGLCCRRSPEMLVGLLGILKAGGAYLPLDPAYPPDRLRFMLDDGGARHLVLQRGLEPELPRQALQVFHPPEAGEANFPPLPPPQPEDLAYLIYTSGSTGRPKGVCVSHRNLLASTAARFAFYAESPARFLLLSSLSFDSSVAGLFWTLSTGGTLLLPPERAEQDLQELGGRIARWQATHTLLLPSLYGLLLRQARPQDLSSLRCVIVAGEACPPAVCARHFETLPRTALFNEYGPTEATVWCV